jgi:hypothetical protein
MDIGFNGLTSGQGLNLSGVIIGGSTQFTGDVIRAARDRTISSAVVVTDTGNFLDLARTGITSTDPSAVYNITGDLATLSSNCTQTTGTCVDTSSILSLTQSYGKASGAVLNIVNSGVGSAAAILSNSGGQSALIINKTGNSGDIFTASSSGTPRFSITNAGGIKLGSDEGTDNYCLLSGGVGAGATWEECPAGSGFTQWSLSAGAIYSGNTTLDFLIGGNASSSANFAFLNNAAGTPTFRIRSDSGSQYLDIYHDGTDGVITSSTGTLNLGAGGGTLFVETDIVNDTSNNSGAVKISDKLLVQYPEAGIGNALAIFNNTGSGDIFTASSSGTPRFTINAAGALGLTGGFGISNQCLISQGSGTAATWNTCPGGTGSFDIANGLMYAGNSTLDFAIGGTSTSSAKFAILDMADGSDPIATISATSGALSGNGVVLSAGNSRIQSLKNKDLTIGGDTSGNVIVSGDATSNFQVLFTAAPTVDMAQIINTGFGTTTSGVDGLVVNFATAGSSAQSNSGINVVVTSGNTNAGTILDGIVVATISAQANATERALVIGTGWDQGIVIMSGGASNSGLRYAGAGRPSKKITLSPEFAGAVLTASGSATTIGNMTSDASHSANFRTYYQWSSTNTTLQDYTIAVRVTLPADFDDWATTNAMTIAYQTASSVVATNRVDAYIYDAADSSGNPVYFSTSNQSTSWTNLSLNKFHLNNSHSTDIDTAGDTMIIYIKLYSSGTYNVARLGDIVLTYLAKF